MKHFLNRQEITANPPELIGQQNHLGPRTYQSSGGYFDEKLNPEMESVIPKKVVEHVQPGARGGFKSTSLPEHSWHHNAQNPVKIELVPRAQHKAPGDVQKSLHPNQQGGFKKLQTGIK